ncbi:MULTISPECIES: GNAT family N-acetyltransferase [Shewanella]|uniref:GNAT family N-acetyltransferase n=1 Tax=Shewanella TaxID=22 RepID=UPI001EFD587F|nr:MULTISPECIES: GNAT family N-acetyltransferase [Shewanella]MCG9748542.1 GNAT family N-acetyltransferase [Shewanella sp. Isolate8]MCL2911024.1 GNAT family N-acetyltransferase [Shewanella aquimarina]
MDIIRLIDKPEAIGQVATWYHEEWGHLGVNRTQAELTHTLSQYLQLSGIPQLWLALVDGLPVGAIQLRYQEHPEYPVDSVWLGGIYVIPANRGQGIAKRLIATAEHYALASGADSLYLQTEAKNLALYHSLNWRVIATLPYSDLLVKVMRKSPIRENHDTRD